MSGFSDPDQRVSDSTVSDNTYSHAIIIVMYLRKCNDLTITTKTSKKNSFFLEQMEK